MTDPSDPNFFFEGFPDRPDVPEFWHLSEIVLEHDAQADERGEEGLFEVIERHVPVQVLAYMASQRPRILFARMGAPPQIPAILLALFESLYIDGFTAGAEYAKKYPRPDDESHA